MMQPEPVLDPSLRDLILNPKSNKIPRPPNAFMLFARDHRKPLSKKYPTQSNKKISSLLGECWRKSDDATKAEYFKKSKMMEELHRQQYPDYVYSPRIARIQKMARKKKHLGKSEGKSQPKDDEMQLESIGPSNVFNHGSDKSDEWNNGSSEKKQSNPVYIPNNPQYFPDPDHGPPDEETCTADIKPPTVESEDHACPNCPPQPWKMPPAESMAAPCTGRCPDECSSRSEMYAENYYPKMAHPEMYDYGPWNRYPDYPYESTVSSSWSPCAGGCQGECSTTHPKDEHSTYSHLTSSQHPDLKNSYYHYEPPVPYRNPPYPYTYGPYGSDSSMPYMAYRYVPCKKEPKASFSFPPRDMEFYHNQYQHHFKDYYPKFSFSAQPKDCPSVQETACSSGYHPIKTEEMTESGSTGQSTDSQYQNVEQIKTVSVGNDIFNVVEVKSDQSYVLSEEVVESTNPELGQVDRDV